MWSPGFAPSKSCCEPRSVLYVHTVHHWLSYHAEQEERVESSQAIRPGSLSHSQLLLTQSGHVEREGQSQGVATSELAVPPLPRRSLGVVLGTVGFEDCARGRRMKIWPLLLSVSHS